MLRSLVGSEMCIRDRSEIRELEESQVYHTLMNIRDWDEYFEQTKMKLNAEYQFLKTEHEQLRKVRTEKK